MFQRMILGSTAMLVLSAVPAIAQNPVLRPPVTFPTPVVRPTPLPVPMPTPPIFQHHYDVQYRQARWQTLYFDTQYEAYDYARYLRAQGYEVDIDRVAYYGVIVRFRMASWTTYRTVVTHREAHDLERWLERQGYDARVLHH